MPQGKIDFSAQAESTLRASVNRDALAIIDGLANGLLTSSEYHELQLRALGAMKALGRLADGARAVRPEPAKPQAPGLMFVALGFEVRG